MEKLCMISLDDFYALGYSSYAVDDKEFIERINDKYKIENSNNLIPMKKIVENDKTKYVDMLTGKEFYPQTYDEEETRKMFPKIRDWKEVYNRTKPFCTKDGSIRFMEGSVREYNKNMVEKSKIFALRLQKIYLENSLLYKTKMSEQNRVRKLESKLKSINKLSK